MLSDIVVVGGGQCAAVAARTLRRRGFDGHIEIIGAEADPPYQRPPLSKEYLETGDAGGLSLLSEQWCADKNVRLRLGERVLGLDPAAGRVRLADGSVRADAVLIATGGRPRMLPGVTGERVHTLRTRRDADRLRAVLAPGATIVVVGAGFIGSEVAATARARGAEVVVLEALDTPLRTVLGADLGAVCAALHRAHGVDLRLRETVSSVAEGSQGITVVTSRGRRIDADAVVVGIGMEPATEVAEGAGIAVADGIVVDECGRTSVPAVFAAGDVARHYHPLLGEHVRTEHFDSANRLAAAAANTMLGRATAFAEPPWFWSDQYDVNLQYAGHAATWDEIVVRGSVADFDFCAFYLSGGVVRAAFAADRGGDIAGARELIARAVPVDADVLRDDDADLLELVPEGVA
ncbi:NAD(P)/FAD-dependent oxidoreductase [Prauserella muralis]|uniref:Pyridine nucleotide-disulfide oxidoreductase n=1 Tax=Prauserella muralis TaxID=588067 RepID=A0A2V4ATE2_9PSEU|nr:FAD-dependent oxidoreductase [Prauserella muralis]PXY22811.1 pyridine nucleotide-disulfide oxidoreductase [Prauserella muralis]TWE28559.1 3-phenylpropionate/trans-cinnamate dioxygenase ferredoxin reductase subunit [Prauserella muralis]